MARQVERLGVRLSALALGALLTACVTPTGGSVAGDGRVVERSKPEAPAWTAWSTGRMHDKDGAYSYVQLNARLRDLPLGLKQTQLAAVEGSRAALTETVKELLSDQRDDLGASAQAELDRRIGDVTADAHQRHAKVTDIYFEKLEQSGEPPEYFNAFVLVTVPKDKLPELMETLGRRLGGAGDAGLRALGQELLRRLKSGGNSH